MSDVFWQVLLHRFKVAAFHFALSNATYSIEIFCRNAVKITDEEIFVKEPKTRAGNRYVYFSSEMESLLREYQKECRYITETYDQRELTTDDFLFRRQGAQLPMTPTAFTYRFKRILKKNGLPQELNVHSLRHTAASLMKWYRCGNGGRHPRPQPALHYAGYLYSCL